jgi:hypothetical protein
VLNSTKNIARLDFSLLSLNVAIFLANQMDQLLEESQKYLSPTQFQIFEKRLSEMNQNIKYQLFTHCLLS